MGLTVDSFHDVVCGWCFNISPRLRVLAAEFDIEVRHRTFVLQDSPEQMVAVFGSMDQAKETILGHWAACRAASDTPELFNIEDMRAASFDYPYGLPAALFCKAAERLSGQGAHWDMFDRIQTAHITEARNVADMDGLLDIASDLGFDRDRFRRAVFDPGTRIAVDADRHLARRIQVRSVPTVIVRETGTRLVNGPIGDLRAQLGAALRLSA
ncbi:DsbA family protein [uncultured Roseibium sp.]|uniref:DsbA family oxidoreductase n=1 Tax=uncultured Roseibium sp. TaxID=1936171 RepID=UPI0032171548